MRTNSNLATVIFGAEKAYMFRSGAFSSVRYYKDNGVIFLSEFARIPTLWGVD